MMLRTVSRVLVGTLVVVLGGFLLIRARMESGPAAPTLRGTNLGSVAAPTFSLTDPTGASVDLAAQRGHPVVLTFLFTHCPDECPLTAEKLRATADALGPRAADVRWLAVSVDPQGDTPAAARAFVATHKLEGKLQYLLGTQAQLQPVWKAYGVAVVDSATSVGHTGGVYLVDAQGRERVYLAPDFDPAVLAANLRALLPAG